MRFRKLITRALVPLVAVGGLGVLLTACAPVESHCYTSDLGGDNTYTNWPSPTTGSRADVGDSTQHKTWQGKYDTFHTSWQLGGINTGTSTTPNETLKVVGAVQDCIMHFAAANGGAGAYSRGITVNSNSNALVYGDASETNGGPAIALAGDDTGLYRLYVYGTGCIDNTGFGDYIVQNSYLACGSGIAFHGQIGTGTSDTANGSIVDKSYVYSSATIFDHSNRSPWAAVTDTVFDVSPGAISPNWSGFGPPDLINGGSTNCHGNTVTSSQVATIPQATQDAWNAACTGTTFVGSAGHDATVNAWKSSHAYGSNA